MNSFVHLRCCIADSEAAKKLKCIVLNDQLLKDVARLSSNYQTSSLESFHSLLNQFAPKKLPYSFKGMLDGWMVGV